MHLKAYQSSEGWCCQTCHLDISVCQCHPGDYHEYRYVQHVNFSAISDWMFKHYGVGYDTWKLRLKAACAHIGHQLDGGPLAFRCSDLPSAERVDRLIRIMTIRAKARKDVSRELEAVEAKIKPRHWEVLTLIAAGRSHQEIAKAMAISVGGSRELLRRSRSCAAGLIGDSER